MRLFRWKAIVPMALTAALLAAAWLVWVDHAIRRGIEAVGTELVGARVELAGARLRLRSADLVLTGLRVTDPYAPMTNLFEAAEIVADLDGRALLEQKAVVESLVVHGVRFGTPRHASGALERPGPTTGLVTRRLLAWTSQIRIPTLDLEGLAGTVVNIGAISADSLRSLAQARAVVAAGDSLRAAWESELRLLDPGPLIDSTRAVLEQLRGIDPRGLNAVQAARAANDARAAAQRLAAARERVASFRTNVETGARALRAEAGRMDQARTADYAYARGLLNVPSLAAPDISMSLFGEMALTRLQPILYWVNLAEAYIPPGLDPRRHQGPRRARRAGTVFAFPRAREYPLFLLERGAADLVIGGRTAARGAYRFTVTGLTSAPALYGRPTVFSAARVSSVGPRDLRVGGVMDRLGRIPRDSVRAVVGGVSLPPLAIPTAGATLDFGPSTIDLAVTRSGEGLSGWWRLRADTARWSRGGADTVPAAEPRMGSRAWASALLWRSLSSVPAVTIEARVGGTLARPTFAVSSNVGDAVAANLRQAVGAEVARAEQQARAEVDRRVAEQVARARAAVTGAEQRLQQVTAQVERLEALRLEVDEQVRRLTSGVRLPSLPGLRRP